MPSTPATASSARTPASRGHSATPASPSSARPRKSSTRSATKSPPAASPKLAKVPILGGTDAPVGDMGEAKKLAEQLGYPVMVKASMGGGGRGMRPVLTADQLEPSIDQARREAGAAFGVPDVFLEKYVRRARHVEVQLLGDNHGGLVHLFERDCSLQRRHQKIVEVAPSQGLPEKTRQALYDAALAVGRSVGLNNAGTVEFLVDADTGEHYFIEVNPRIQVEHTVTEAITGYEHRQVADLGGPRLAVIRSGNRN